MTTSNMPIDELIKYHQDAITYLENQQKALAEGDQLLIPVGIATDFHRRAVVVLMAAKAMFDKAEAGGPPPDKIVTL
jgi:dTDP-4-dehydrorhamnose 3,5-epimerase-like enzyme